MIAIQSQLTRENNAEILKAFLAEIAEILKDMHLVYAKILSAY